MSRRTTHRINARLERRVQKKGRLLGKAPLVLMASLCLLLSGIASATANQTETDRIAGPNRYATAVQVSKELFNPEDTYDVYVASGRGYPDALAAGPAAASEDAPLLLVPRKGVIPKVVREELKRLDPSSIDIVGGPKSVSSQIEGQLHDYADYVWRWSGANRYETAANVAFLAGDDETVFIASGTGFADALGGGATASRVGGSLLLTRPGKLPGATRDELDFSDPGEVVILGGKKAISPRVKKQIKKAVPKASISRRAGKDRYATAVAASRFGFPGSASTVYLASGSAFPDALAGGPAATHVAGAALLLTKRNCVPASTRKEIKRLGADRVVALGGKAAISGRALKLTPCK